MDNNIHLWYDNSWKGNRPGILKYVLENINKTEEELIDYLNSNNNYI